MSDYRDDTAETAVIKDETWIGFTVLGRSVEEYARMFAALLVTISVLHAEQATAADELLDGRLVGWMEESAHASDEALGRLGSSGLTVETAKLRDATISKTGGVTVESAHMTDMLLMSASDATVETMRAAAETWGTLHASAIVAESARLSDRLLREVRDLVPETAAGLDAIWGRLRATGVVAEIAHAADDMPAVHAAAAAGAVVEMARAFDATWGALHAADLVEDGAQADALIVEAGGAVAGQAWVSEGDNWALSRYAPFGFHAVTVIDGVVWLAGSDGLYALDGDTEEIEAILRTGKVDVSGGALAVPIQAYLEYELQGTATMSVSQTQGGAATQTYTYSLEAEPADVLTNGRFIFGRGLRGRHFTFELSLIGTACYLNDWTTLIVPTKRRI